MYKNEFGINNRQWLIYHRTKPNQNLAGVRDKAFTVLKTEENRDWEGLFQTPIWLTTGPLLTCQFWKGENLLGLIKIK